MLSSLWCVPQQSLGKVFVHAINIFKPYAITGNRNSDMFKLAKYQLLKYISCVISLVYWNSEEHGSLVNEDGIKIDFL